MIKFTNMMPRCYESIAVIAILLIICVKFPFVKNEKLKCNQCGGGNSYPVCSATILNSGGAHIHGPEEKDCPSYPQENILKTLEDYFNKMNVDASAYGNASLTSENDTACLHIISLDPEKIEKFGRLVSGCISHELNECINSLRSDGDSVIILSISELKKSCPKFEFKPDSDESYYPDNDDYNIFDIEVVFENEEETSDVNRTKKGTSDGNKIRNVLLLNVSISIFIFSL